MKIPININIISDDDYGYEDFVKLHKQLEQYEQGSIKPSSIRVKGDTFELSELYQIYSKLEEKYGKI